MIGAGMVMLLLVPVIASLVVRAGFSRLVAALSVLFLAILFQLQFGSGAQFRIFQVAKLVISGLVESPAAVWLVLSCMLSILVETSPEGRVGKSIAVLGNTLAAQRAHLALWPSEHSRSTALATIHPLGVTTIIVALTADLSLTRLASALLVPFLFLAIGYEWHLLGNTKESPIERKDLSAVSVAALGVLGSLGLLFGGFATPDQALAFIVLLAGVNFILKRDGQGKDDTFGQCLSAAGVALVLVMLASCSWMMLGLGNSPDLFAVFESSPTLRSVSVWGLLLLAIGVSATGGALLACVFVWPLIAIFNLRSGDSLHLACMFLLAVALGSSLARQSQSKRDGRWIFALTATLLIVTYFPWTIRILPELLQD